MKYLVVVLASFLLNYLLLGQNVDDALRYSQNTYDATARSSAMGGSYGALGGDFASASINPAGLGLYRAGEICFTPDIGFTTVNSNNLLEENTSFSLSNISYVSSLKTKTDDWKFVNFGIGYNKTSDFNRNSILQNSNSANSLTDVWANTANDEGVTNSSARLPYETYLINYDEDDEKYYSVLRVDDKVKQQKAISEGGKMGELLLSLAGNFKEKVYLGGSIGLNSLNYDLKTNYTETVIKTDSSELDYYNFAENYKIKGFGVSFKAGIIVKPVHSLRLGAAFHTPIFYAIQDTYNAKIVSRFLEEDSDGNDRYEYGSSNNTIEYNFTSPWKFIFSAATLLKDKGAINLDVGFINYAKSNFEAPDNKGYFDGTNENPGVNRYISKQLSNVVNVRIGGEFKVYSDINLRLGYGSYGNPFNNKAVKNVDLSYVVYSAGLGYKSKNFLLNLAWQMYEMNDRTTLYSESASLDFETIKHQAKFSVGWRF